MKKKFDWEKLHKDVDTAISLLLDDHLIQYPSRTNMLEFLKLLNAKRLDPDFRFPQEEFVASLRPVEQQTMNMMNIRVVPSHSTPISSIWVDENGVRINPDNLV